MKTYTIENSEGKKRLVKQRELTLGQDKKLLALVAEKDWDFSFAESDELEVRELLGWLATNDVIPELLDIILIGEKDGIDWNDITNSQLEEIVTDFFTLNSVWISKLKAALTPWLKKTKKKQN